MGILDGHHRFKICQELGGEPKIEAEPRVFKDKLDEKQFVLETNLLRRHLDTWYRMLVAKPLLLIYREKAERQFREHLPEKGEKGFQTVSTKKLEDTGAMAQFAAVVNSNPETARQFLYIDEKARPEIKEKLNKGELKIKAAYLQVQSDQRLEHQ